MAKQSINLGSSANDGGGTTLRAGGDIVNDNFNELYTALGNGTALQIALGSPSTGDVLTYNGSIFTTATPSTLANIVEDTTPQLGGNLDVNAKQIVSVSNNNIVIAPNGSGAIVLDGQTWPTADGTANQVLKTDGSGNLAYGNVEAVVNIDGANNLESATLAVGDKLLVSDGGTEGRALLSQVDTLFTSTTQTLTNKTLTNPILSPTATTAGKVEFLEGTDNGTNKATLIGPASTADVTVTLPAATDTLVGKATTDTLTNKTIAGSANTLSAIANSSLTNSSLTIGSTSIALGATVTTFAGLASVTSTNFVGDITGDVTGTADVATVATTVTITDNENTNENNALIFAAGGDLDGGNLGLESDGDLKYNPSTGTLSVPNISVSGTFSTVNSVTMDANNAVIFEGSTADAHETTLTSIDATADRTISLPNVSGTIPVLAAVSTTAITSTPEELNVLDLSLIHISEPTRPY